MPLRGPAALAAACAVVVVTAVPATARWLTSSAPGDAAGATLRVDDTATVIDHGWQVAWKIQIRCPRGERIIGRALIAQRDPASIPALAGEDQGITAVLDLAGQDRCTGHRQVLHLVLDVLDTRVVDPTTGETVTYHQPIEPTSSMHTSAAVQLHSAPGARHPFFVQYCAAPNCASESGPRVTLR